MFTGRFGPDRAGGGGSSFSEYGSIEDQGILFVPPSYYQVSSDNAVQLDSANDWIASKIIPETDFPINALAWYVTAVATQGDLALELYSHDVTNNQPDTSLATLVAASDSGDTADVWIQEALGTAQQLYAGKIYWIVGKGTAGDDYSVSTRRWNTTQGSAFPRSMHESKITTDGGSTWTGCTQDSKDALWNIIINPQTDGVPYLGYGRKYGNYIVMPSGIEEINLTGHWLDCAALTADILYYVYMDSNGDLEASTTEWVVSNGLRVKTGEITKKFLGLICPKDILGGGDQAPVDVSDMVLVAYRGMHKVLGKPNPYGTDTVETYNTQTITWRQWMNNTDWKVEFIGNQGNLMATGVTNSANNAKGLSIGIDATTPCKFATKGMGYPAVNEITTKCEFEGLEIDKVHYTYPLMRVYTGATHGWFWYFTGQWEMAAGFMGQVQWG